MKIAAFCISVMLLLPLLLPLRGFETQKYDYCGEASLAVMLSREGKIISQDKAHEILGLSGIKRGAYSGEILRGLRKAGYNVCSYSSFKYNSRAAAAKKGSSIVQCIREEVEKGRLVFIGWYPWKRVSSRTGHFSLAAGVYPGGLVIADPRYGDRVFFINDDTLAGALPLKSADSGMWGFFYFTLGDTL